MRSEGLTVGCTARGKKEGNQQAHFMVAIAHNTNSDNVRTMPRVN